MIEQAIKYLKDTVSNLELKEDRLHAEELALEAKQKKIVLEREALTARESAFLEKSNGHGKEVERVNDMLKLAKSIKAQADDDKVEMTLERKGLDKREKEIIDLEKKEKELKAREELLEARESDIEDREEFVEKEKKAARDKQKDLDILSKSLKKKQTQLQRMIDAQKT